MLPAPDAPRAHAEQLSNTALREAEHAKHLVKFCCG
jgi:hypothetical protein